MYKLSVQPLPYGGVEHDPGQEHLDGQHRRVLYQTRGEIVKVALAVEHRLPDAAQQDVAAVVDDEPRHNNAQQRRFLAVQHNAVDQSRQHGRNEVAGKIRLAVACQQETHRINDSPGHHADDGAVAHAAQRDGEEAEVNFQARPQQVDGQAFQHDGHGADQPRKGQHPRVVQLAPGSAPVVSGKDGQLLFAHKKSSFVRCRTREEAIFVGWAQRRIRRCTPSCSSGMRNLHRGRFRHFVLPQLPVGQALRGQAPRAGLYSAKSVLLYMDFGEKQEKVFL